MSKALAVARLHPSAHVRRDMDATPPEGTTPEDLLDPAYWRHHGAGMAIGSKVYALEETGAWYAEYLIIDAGPTYAKLRTIYVDLIGGIVKEDAISDYDFKWNVGSRSWSIIRLADKTLLRGANQDGFKSKEAAQEWLRDYQRVRAA